MEYTGELNLEGKTLDKHEVVEIGNAVIKYFEENQNLTANEVVEQWEEVSRQLMRQSGYHDVDNDQLALWRVDLQKIIAARGGLDKV